MNKYLKYSLYLIPIVVFFYIFRKKVITQGIIANDIDYKIEPPHSHDFAYKQAYLAPVDGKDETCRANTNNHLTCTSNCRNFQLGNFQKCIYTQPEYIALSSEDGLESNHSKKIKSLKYY